MNIIYQIAEVLNLQTQFEIQLRSKVNKKADGLYWALYKDGGSGKLHKHIIRIFLGNIQLDTRSLDTLIAHELIHAWQEENNIAEHHGPEFIRQAYRIGRIFSLPDIYIEELDK